MGRWRLVLWFWALPLASWGQLEATITQPLIIDCVSPQLPIANSDSVKQRVALDSISPLLVGRWKLIREASGWSSPKTPNWLAELLIDQQGQCVVLIDGNWVSSFRLTLSMKWGRVLFASSEHKGAHFLGFTNPDPRRPARKRRLGRIDRCGSYLFVSDNAADGRSHTYERVATTEPDITSLTPTVCRDSLSLHSSVMRVNGRVQYRADLHAYIIDYLPGSGSAKHQIGILCNWPQAKEYVGKTVAYSGNYYHRPGELEHPTKEEVIYYLRITGFHPVD